MMKGKQKYSHSVITFFCKSTQNALHFLFYTCKCHLHTDGVNINLAVGVSYEMSCEVALESNLHESTRQHLMVMKS